MTMKKSLQNLLCEIELKRLTKTQKQAIVLALIDAQFIEITRAYSELSKNHDGSTFKKRG
jgi:hypothetical protein